MGSEGRSNALQIFYDRVSASPGKERWLVGLCVSGLPEVHCPPKRKLMRKRPGKHKTRAPSVDPKSLNWRSTEDIYQK